MKLQTIIQMTKNLMTIGKIIKNKSDFFRVKEKRQK